MTEDDFWSLIAACRWDGIDMPSFNAALQRTLEKLPDDELWSFYQRVWGHVDRLQWQTGMQFNQGLNDCLDKAMGLRLGGDKGECYGDWAIAQGKRFYDSLLAEPSHAVERLPTWDDVWEGENVLFLANRVFRERTGQFLQDVFKDDLGV
jgi:hypothetical protein